MAGDGGAAWQTMSGEGGERLFEDFLVCSSNEDAVAAARAVAATAPDAPNPLLITGAPADGKTHLVRALVAAFRRQHPGVAAKVMSTERLERLWRDARLPEAMRTWRDEFGRIGLLVIEDVQFLDSRRASLPFLRRLVHELRMAGGFVVLTRDPSDRDQDVRPIDAAKVVRLHAPDFGLRAAVAKRAAAAYGLAIPDDVAELIARRCQNLRQVQGAVMRVHAATDLIRRDLLRAAGQD